ncbi:MAG TPA: 3-dehydroquinate synthase [Blastocatellia bacterium]|nr:3-dehydroquinate synthase [Blastocatellia bacterium]
MKTIPVRLRERSYRILIGAGSIDEAGVLARATLGEKALRAVVLTNKHLDGLYGDRVRRALTRAGFTAHTFLVGDGERFKTLGTAESILTFLIGLGIERSDVMVALGGGVIGDLAGFAASIYLRGIRVVHVPTTLLSQIDSSVGGKTGVNHRLGKNLIGSFHQPSLVLIDPETLVSLPPREVRSGLFEALKYGVIADSRLFQRIARDTDLLTHLDQDSLAHLIARCCSIKATVVSGDEREAGLRKTLNFGHTIGHALEAVTNYRRFLHGEAVGHGMRAASRIAEQVGLLSRSDRQSIDGAIQGIGRLPAADTLALDAIISAMHHDKKSEAGRISFVLPVEIGRVVVKSDVPPRVVRSALKDSFRSRQR